MCGFLGLWLSFSAAAAAAVAPSSSSFISIFVQGHDQTKRSSAHQLFRFPFCSDFLRRAVSIQFLVRIFGGHTYKSTFKLWYLVAALRGQSNYIIIIIHNNNTTSDD